MAAAASWSRSRGVAGVRATKSLFSIFTLLCLVCLSSSLTTKDQVKQLKEKIQRAQQKLDMEKATLTSSSELMNYYVKLMDPLMVLMKGNSEDLTAAFPPLEGLMDCMKDFVEKTKTFTQMKNEELVEEVEMKEQKLRTMMELLNSIEEKEAEL